ncbi:hypothetical protein MASR2M66_25800 [Chloroflexota bacterium]
MFSNKKYVVVLTIALLLLTACGAQGNSNEVKITLTDFGMESSRTSFEVGVPYHFVITNEGAINHEMMIMAPLTEMQMSMDMDMEEMDALALAMIKEDELTPGATMTLDYTFTEPAPDGTLEFACHVEGHYVAGMKLPITVK